jgi:hypothetical protein
MTEKLELVNGDEYHISGGQHPIKLNPLLLGAMEENPRLFCDIMSALRGPDFDTIASCNRKSAWTTPLRVWVFGKKYNLHHQGMAQLDGKTEVPQTAMEWADAARAIVKWDYHKVDSAPGAAHGYGHYQRHLQRAYKAISYLESEAAKAEPKTLGDALDTLRAETETTDDDGYTTLG